MAYFKYLPKLLYTTSLTDQNYKLVCNLFAKSKFASDVVNNSSLYYTYDVQENEKPEDVANKFYKDPFRYWIILMTNNITDPQYDWVLHSSNFNRYINSKYSSLTVGLKKSETYSSNYTVGETVYQGGTSIYASSATAIVSAYDSTNKVLTLKFPTEVLANNTTANAYIRGTSSNQSHSVISIVPNNDGYQWASNTQYGYVVTETKYNDYDNIKTITQYNVSSKDYNYKTDALINRDLSTSTNTYALADGTNLIVAKQVKQITFYDYEYSLNEKRRSIKIIKPEYIPQIENEFSQLMGS